MQEHVRDVPVLTDTDPVRTALETLLSCGLPALPVVGADGRYRGVFGEREFIAAVFPKYLGTLSYAGFVPDDLDDALEQQSGCVLEPIAEHLNTEHVDLPPDASEASIAETFLHHRVLIVPVVDHGTVRGVVRRSEFFSALARKALERGGA